MCLNFGDYNICEKTMLLQTHLKLIIINSNFIEYNTLLINIIKSVISRIIHLRKILTHNNE